MARRIKTRKVATFIGAPSVGKTTLALGLYHKIKLYGYDVEFVPEYAREHVSKYGHPTSIYEQLFIAQKQAQLEDRALDTKAEIIVAEAPPVAGYTYGMYFLSNLPKDLMVLEELHQLAIRRKYNYNYIYYIPPEIPFKDDGVRINDKTVIKKLDIMLHGATELWFPNYVTITGGPQARIMKVIKDLKIKEKK
jgi:nicotinamide riboside kinase